MDKNKIQRIIIESKPYEEKDGYPLMCQTQDGKLHKTEPIIFDGQEIPDECEVVTAIQKIAGGIMYEISTNKLRVNCNTNGSSIKETIDRIATYVKEHTQIEPLVLNEADKKNAVTILVPDSITQELTNIIGVIHIEVMDVL